VLQKALFINESTFGFTLRVIYSQKILFLNRHLKSLYDRPYKLFFIDD